MMQFLLYKYISNKKTQLCILGVRIVAHVTLLGLGAVVRAAVIVNLFKRKFATSRGAAGLDRVGLRCDTLVSYKHYLKCPNIIG